MKPETKAFAFLLLFSAVSAIAVAGGIRAFGESGLQEQYNEKSGFYCQDKDTNPANQERNVDLKLFSQKINPDKTLRFAAEVFYSNNTNFEIFAAHAAPAGPNKWRYEENLKSADPHERCAVNVSLTDTKSWLVEQDPKTRCYKHESGNLRFQYLGFNQETRISSATDQDIAAQLWNIETFGHVLSCTGKGAVPKPLGDRTP